MLIAHCSRQKLNLMFNKPKQNTHVIKNSQNPETMCFHAFFLLQKPTKSLQMSYKLSDEKDLTKSQIEYFFSPIAMLYYLL